MKFVVRINDYYYFNRRVPEEVREYDPRERIRVSLKTDSKEIARRKAIILNDQIEGYWQELIAKNQPYENKSFQRAVRIARQLGFSYQPMATVIQLPRDELLNRIMAVNEATPKQIRAVLGTDKVQALPVSAALVKFWEFTKDRTIHKTPEQLRKWRSPRLRAIDNFTKVVGNKDIKMITRDDSIKFRDWWVARVQAEGLNAATANKDIVHIKNIMETVSDNLKLDIDVKHVFRKLILKKRFSKKRLPFTSEQIRTMLHSEKLQNLNTEARWFLFAAADTGARPSEILGLLPEDIKLDADIPYIFIKDRQERALKTAHSERKIPLVGYSLEAFKNMPLGFPGYRDRTDSLTATVNKFLRENKLLPSSQHTIYSFRHSFQNRLLAVKAPDRVQVDLMGHKFQREDYGDGSSLELKKEFMEMICLKT